MSGCLLGLNKEDQKEQGVREGPLNRFLGCEEGRTGLEHSVNTFQRWIEKEREAGR